MSILCSTADAAISGNWFILFKVLTLIAVMLARFWHLSQLGLSLGSVTDFSNAGVEAPTSAKHASCSPREGRCGLEVWFELIMEIFHWPLFFLISIHHLYRWVAVVCSLDIYLILAVYLRRSSTQHLVKSANDPHLDSFPLLHIHHGSTIVSIAICLCGSLIISTLRECYLVTSQAMIFEWFGSRRENLIILVKWIRWFLMRSKIFCVNF